MMRINLTINFTDETHAVRVLESVSPDKESTRGLDSLRATLEDLTSAIDLTLRTHEAID
jgi:hypothetical protein